MVRPIYLKRLRSSHEKNSGDYMDRVVTQRLLTALSNGFCLKSMGLREKKPEAYSAYW